MESTRNPAALRPKTRAFAERSVDPTLLAATHRFTNHSVSVGQSPRSAGHANGHPEGHSEHPFGTVSDEVLARRSTIWIMILTVLLGLSIAGFATVQSLSSAEEVAAERVTSLRTDPSSPGQVVVESVGTATDAVAYPNGERAPIHRYSVPAEQAAELQIGATVPSRFANDTSGASTNEMLAAIVIGLCLIGVGMLVIGATGTGRPIAMHH